MQAGSANRRYARWSSYLGFIVVSACGSDDEQGDNPAGVAGATASAGASGGMAVSATGGFGGGAASTGGAGNTPSATGSGGTTSASGSGGSTATTGSGGSFSPTGSGGSTPAGAGGSMTPTGAGGSMTPTGSGGAPPMTGHPVDLNGTTCLKPSTTSYGERGPYRVATVDVDLGMDICPNQQQSRFTIFYPDPLEESCPHPIIAWGNGTTVADTTTYAFFNENAASHGIVAIASADPNAGCGEYHKKGLDYLLQENENPSSRFYQKLSPRAGVAGHSQGAGGSARGATHPNVQANVAVGGTGSSSEKVAFLCLTGTEDIGNGSLCADAAISRGSGYGFGASWEGGDHIGTETLLGYITGDPGTRQMQRLYAAWFRCFLADDGEACKLFMGGTPDGCGMCQDMGWAALASKNL